MDKNTSPFGTVEVAENGYQGHLKRLIDHPVAKVWQALTDSQILPKWLAPGTIETKQTGTVHIDFSDSGIVIDSTVSAIDAPHLLEYSWSNGDQPLRPLRWTLEQTGQGSCLTLTVKLPEGEDAAKACAGFEAHLDMLLAALEEIPIKFPFDLFLEARKHYNAQLETT